MELINLNLLNICIYIYKYGLPRPPPGDLPNPGIKPRSPALQADSLPKTPGIYTTMYKIDN